MSAHVINPGPAPVSSPTAFLLWGARLQWRGLVLGMLCGIGWMTSLALVPAALGQAIDKGLVHRDTDALIRWSLVLAALAVLIGTFGAIRHWFAVQNWLDGAFRTVIVTDEAVTTRGQEIARTVPTGDVVAVTASDMSNIGHLYDTNARFAGAIVSYIVVAILLLRASVETGLVVLIGGPLLMISLAVIIRPLQKRQAEQREQSGKLTTLGTDTVAGLRILRGIGGEDAFVSRYAVQSQRVRRAGVRVAGYQASLDAAQQLLPGLFVVLVIWTGAHAVLNGKLTPGELVAFYGYATFLSFPLRTATEMVEHLIKAHVSAAKVLRVLRIESDHAEPVAPTAPLPIDAPITDPDSGAAFRPGLLTAVVSARPEDSAALADRIGRLGPAPSGVRFGDFPVADQPIERLRQQVIVSDAEPRLFSGQLRAELSGGRTIGDAKLLDALDVASAGDILDALPDGLSAEVEEKGRGFSGGQRQRLGLARVLAIDPPVLVLIEPTSAVDAHTETRIGARLADYRRDRTTIVATASPLLLQHADEVVLLEDGLVTARGTHRSLLAGNPAYRRIVIRGGDDE